MQKTEKEAWTDLATEIINSAVKDWRHLCKIKAHPAKFNALRNFFNSELCEVLCQGADPQLIIERVEAEYAQRITA